MKGMGWPEGKSKVGKGDLKNHQLGIIEGEITRGKLKGKPFKIRLGATPADCQIVAGGHVVLCTKMKIEVDIDKPTTQVTFECWMLPEDD